MNLILSFIADDNAGCEGRKITITLRGAREEDWQALLVKLIPLAWKGEVEVTILGY